MAENSRKCFKCHRSPSVDPETKLFRFPKPGITNILRCELWAKYCFPDGQWSSQEFQLNLHKEHKMLCEKHFKMTSFSDYPTSTKKLHRFAFPEDEALSAPVFVPQPMPSCSRPLWDKTNILMGKQTTSIIPGVCALDEKKQLPDKEVVFVPQPNPSGSSQSRPTRCEQKQTVSKVQQPKSKSKNQDSSCKSDKEKYLYNKCRKHMKKICQLRNRINKLKNKRFLQEISENESIQGLMNKLSPTFALLLQSQIKKFSRKSKGRRWTREEKIVALRLYKRSPTCYRLMRRLFCLPTQSSLKALLGQFDMKVGINKNIFNVLKQYTKRQKSSDNEYVLMFDEMSIKKNLQYNKKNYIIEGFQDHGLQGRSPQVATNALVFMVAGIRKKVKEPVAFYLSSGFVTADRLSILIKEVIQECIKAGLNITATVCDMDGVNRRALGILGATVEKPCIKVDNIEIISIFDPPHLLKCFRNLLFKYDMKCNTQNITSENKTGEGIAKWSHIVKFHDLDSRNPNFVFAPSLKTEHLNPNTKQKMKVKLAAQVFSHTVAAGMMAKIAQGELSTEAVTTVDVIENMDKLFDTLNSDSTDLRRGKIFATNMKSTTPHLQFLKKMKTFFGSIQFIGCYRPPPSKEGWIWTLNAIEQLWQTLTRKHKDVKSLATRRLQQDPIENLFGCIRGNCGSSTNPTAGQFVAALKTAMLSNLAHLSAGNCERDALESIINNYKILLKQQPTNICTEVSSMGSQNIQISSDIPEEFEECWDPEMNESGEEQACAYVCGFLLKNMKIECKECKNIFFAKEKTLDHLFVDCKEYDQLKNKLNYCSRDFLNYVEKCATHTNTTIQRRGHETNIKLKVLADLQTLSNNFMKKCPLHFDTNQKCVLESIFFICIKRYCILKNRVLQEEASKASLKKKNDILKHK